MLFLSLLSALVSPAFGEIFITNDETQKLLDLVQPDMTAFTQKMAQNISEGHNKRHRLFGRHELEKRSLTRKIEIYAAETFGQPSLDSFHDPLKAILDNGMQDYHRKVSLRKRSGETITEAQRRAEAREHAQVVANKIQNHLRAHTKVTFQEWINDHRGKKKSAQSMDAQNAGPNPFNTQSTGGQQTMGSNQGFNGQSPINNQGFVGQQGFTGQQNAAGSQGFASQQPMNVNQGFPVSQTSNTQGNQGFSGQQGMPGNQDMNGQQQSWPSNQGFNSPQSTRGQASNPMSSSTGGSSFGGQQSAGSDIITNNKRSETDLEVLEKRALFEKNNKNMAIWGIVFAFLLVPFLFNPFVVGFGGMLAALLWAAFFVGPIFNKILFGSWF